MPIQSTVSVLTAGMFLLLGGPGPSSTYADLLNRQREIEHKDQARQHPATDAEAPQGGGADADESAPRESGHQQPADENVLGSLITPTATKSSGTQLIQSSFGVLCARSHFTPSVYQRIAVDDGGRMAARPCHFAYDALAPPSAFYLPPLP